jgi:hypothetical protein
MKRVLIVLACIASTASLGAEKLSTLPHVPQAAPVVQIINGSPLNIHIGDDTSMQVFNSNIPGGGGQFFPSGCTDTADSGVFADIAGALYAPNFAEHPCGSASGGIGAYTAWTPVSITPVTGTGTGGDPFTVVITVDAGATGLRLIETLTYVNGSGTFNTSFDFQNMNAAGGALVFNVFFAGDIYLANSDSGIPYLQPVTNAPGGQDCTAQTYTILFLTTTPNDRYSANGYGTVWSEIGAGQLSSTVATGCIDNGAGNEWDNVTVVAGQGVTVNSGISFTGFVGPPPVQAQVPTLSTIGIAAFVLLLALVGYVLARKTSLGA